MKLVFKTPDIDDKRIVLPMITGSGIMGCDYNFVNLYLWRNIYHQKIAVYDDMLFIKVTGKLGTAYMAPVGKGSMKSAVEILKEDAERSGNELRLVCLTEDLKQRVEDEIPDAFTYEEERDAFDYVYSVDKLADLKGRNLHGKRNHINSFMRQYDDWTFELIDQNNSRRCLEVLDEWVSMENAGGMNRVDVDAERIMDQEALRMLDQLPVVCGAITVKGTVAAFSIGSLTNPEVFNIHIEKASEHFPGSYQMINREMAAMVRKRFPEVRWINREDDMGLDGLRRSKESYFPDLMVRKYHALWK